MDDEILDDEEWLDADFNAPPPSANQVVTAPNTTVLQAACFWSIPKNQNLVAFQKLSPSFQFDDLSALLQAYTQNIKLPKKGRIGMSLEPLFVQAANDYGTTAAPGFRGCMKHSWALIEGSIATRTFSPIHFAARAFSEMQRKTYAGFTPLQRLELSSIAVGWLWSLPTTRVLRLCVPDPSPRDPDMVGARRFEICLRGDSLENVERDRSTMILLHIEDKLLVTTPEQILSCAFESNTKWGQPRLERHIDTLAKAGGGPFVVKREFDTEKKALLLEWIYLGASAESKAWAAKQVWIGGSTARLEAALFNFLIGELLKEDGRAVTWGDEYDTLVSGA